MGTTAKLSDRSVLCGEKEVEVIDFLRELYSSVLITLVIKIQDQINLIIYDRPEKMSLKDSDIIKELDLLALMREGFVLDKQKQNDR